MATSFRWCPFSFSFYRAAERPCGSDSVSGKRGCGPGEKPPPAVASAGLLLQLGLPWQQLRLCKQWRGKGPYVQAHRCVGCVVVPAPPKICINHMEWDNCKSQRWPGRGQRFIRQRESALQVKVGWTGGTNSETGSYTIGSLVYHMCKSNLSIVNIF